MWRYKIDILKELSNRGYTSTKMRKDKIMSEGTMQHIRKGHGISVDIEYDMFNPEVGTVGYNRDNPDR